MGKNKLVKAGVDVGNGKAALSVIHRTAIETFMLPSIRKKVDRDGFGDDIGVDRYHWSVESGGRSTEELTTFVVGDDALGKSGLIQHDRSLERLGGEFEMFFTMVLLSMAHNRNKRMLTKQGLVHLITCVPPKYLNDEMRDRYNDLVGTYYIFKNDEPKPYTYTVSFIDLLEEGRGGMTAFAFGNDGQPTRWFEDIVRGRTKLVDIGYKTLDIYDYDNGEIANESRFDMTHNYGIFPGIVQPITRTLNARGGDWRFVSEYEVEAAVRAYGQGNHQDTGVWVGDSFIPIGKEIGNQSTEHANVIKSLIESDVATEGMGRMKRLIMIGGGEVLMQPMFLSWYPQKFLRIDKHPATCGIENASVVLNSVGNLIYLIANEGKKVVG